MNKDLLRQVSAMPRSCASLTLPQTSSLSPMGCRKGKRWVWSGNLFNVNFLNTWLYDIYVESITKPISKFEDWYIMSYSASLSCVGVWISVYYQFWFNLQLELKFMLSDSEVAKSQCPLCKKHDDLVACAWWILAAKWLRIWWQQSSCHEISFVPPK